MESYIALLGLLLFLIGFIWLVVIAFKKSMWWGVTCLLMPLTVLILADKERKATGIPGLLFFFGFILLFSGIYANSIM